MIRDDNARHDDPKPAPRTPPAEASDDAPDEAAERWLSALLSRGGAASSAEAQPQKRGDGNDHARGARPPRAV